MYKKILSQFRENAMALGAQCVKPAIVFNKYATALAARHPRAAKRIVATFYGFGDGLIVIIPPYRNGALATLANLDPDWKLFVTSYGANIIPFVVSGFFVVCSLIIPKRYNIGTGGQGAGAALMVYDLFKHDQRLSAWACIPTVIGGVFGASCSYLERNYGDAQNWIVRNTIGSPKKMVTVCFASTATFMLASSILESSKPLIISSLSWLAGNFVNFFLPQEEQSQKPMLLPSSPNDLPSRRSGANIEKLDT